jgi:hypothetical protein
VGYFGVVYYLYMFCLAALLAYDPFSRGLRLGEILNIRSPLGRRSSIPSRLRGSVGPPWTAEVTPNCFIVRDANGQALSYVYYESEPGRRSAAKLLSKDEARRIAANMAKLSYPFLSSSRSFPVF